MQARQKGAQGAGCVKKHPKPKQPDNRDQKRREMPKTGTKTRPQTHKENPGRDRTPPAQDPSEKAHSRISRKEKNSAIRYCTGY
jgi:hypothetical protein